MSNRFNGLNGFIAAMPKVELHVHLEGSVQPATLLQLAKRHKVDLPATDIEGVRRWYQFTDFDHFLRIYSTVSTCLKDGDDLELITREFLRGQASQNIVYSEVTFTPHNQLRSNGLGFREQFNAVCRGREWAQRELGVTMGLIIDIPSNVTPEKGDMIAEWVVEGRQDGVVALGLGGPEEGNPPEKFSSAFKRVRGEGIPCILHAGEGAGPESVRSAIEVAGSVRIGHGVRSIEDPELVAHLAETGMHLEVCPSSNLCTRIYSSLEEHPLPRLMEAGLNVSINSDDPPMFNTTLTDEYLKCQAAFGWDRSTVEQLVMNAVHATLLSDAQRLAMANDFAGAFAQI